MPDQATDEEFAAEAASALMGAMHAEMRQVVAQHFETEEGQEQLRRALAPIVLALNPPADSETR